MLWQRSDHHGRSDSAGGDQVSFRFAGGDRSASIDELLGVACYEEHQRVLDDYERERAQNAPAISAARATPAMAMAPPPSPDPAECYAAPDGPRR